MSVVGDDWDALKRFNLAELSKPTPRVTLKADAKPERVTTDEALAAPTTTDMVDPRE
jgi:hypothetical protein